MPTAFKTLEEVIDLLLTPSGGVSEAALRRANISRTMLSRMRATQKKFVKTMDAHNKAVAQNRMKRAADIADLGEAPQPKDNPFGWGRFPNTPNNQYNHALQSFMKVQSPRRRIVNGQWAEYTPNKPWMDAKGRINGPVAEWAPGESKPRLQGLKPTSSCFSQFYYFPISRIMLYKFRNRQDTTYQKAVPRATFNRWITSGSLGKFYNKFIRGK